MEPNKVKLALEENAGKRNAARIIVTWIHMEEQSRIAG